MNSTRVVLHTVCTSTNIVLSYVFLLDIFVQRKE